MGGNYQKDLYKQLMEVMSIVDSLKSEQKQNKKEIKSLTSEVISLHKEVSFLKQENAALTEKCIKLENENTLLRNDNERMKRILNNDSSNSSIPPSKDENIKPANTYNSRKSTTRKLGAQKGYKGTGLSKASVEEKIHKGVYEHRIEEIGTPGRPYITRYCLDLDVKTVATEIRIYTNNTGKYQVPPELKGDVTYGRGIKAIAAFLYSEGVVANDRICTFQKKDLDTLNKIPLLSRYTGILTHDHETALYHFGTGHGESNVHLGRYLCKNTEETSNRWSHDLEMLLKGLTHARNELKSQGVAAFNMKQLERFRLRYDELIEQGYKTNKDTHGRLAKKEEKTFLNRLVKYKENHLLFLSEFRVHYSNNMSEKELRICKNRDKMAGGFRTASGREMYCRIMSFIETVKRRELNIYHSIMALMAGEPVIQ